MLKGIPMKKLALWIWFMTAALMANPVIYAGLGDIVYDNVPKIEALSEVGAMTNERPKIDQYLQMCADTKTAGYALDKGPRDEAKEHNYLVILRKLNAQYEYYVHVAHTALNNSMADNDYANFSGLIQTGLIDIDKNGDEIVAFYEGHKGMGTLVEVEDYIEYQTKMKKLEKREQTQRHEVYKSYKQRRIEQVRERQEAKKEARLQEVNEEADRKKEELRRMQQEELNQLSN